MLLSPNAKEVRFAHQPIAHGITPVHGQSSHQVKAAEIFADRPILCGRGDFLNDYEDIGGYERFRSDFALLYLPTLDPQHDQRLEVRPVPMQVRRSRLNRASGADAKWFCDLLNQLGAADGTRAESAPDHTLTLHPAVRSHEWRSYMK
jgi:poly-gamma-glutamate synthesis protein (capsule biosynthesis protein)